MSDCSEHIWDPCFLNLRALGIHIYEWNCHFEESQRSWVAEVKSPDPMDLPERWVLEEEVSRACSYRGGSWEHLRLMFSVRIISLGSTQGWGLRYSVYTYKEPLQYCTLHQVSGQWKGDPPDFRLSGAQPESGGHLWWAMRPLGKMSWVSSPEHSQDWQPVALDLPSVCSSLTFIQHDHWARNLYQALF